MQRVSKKKRVLRLVVALASCGAVCLIATACGGGESSASSGSDGGKVLIGGIFDESGPYAQYGVYGLGGTELGVKELNRKGFTVAGKHYTFELKVEDSQSNLSQAVADARKLVQQDHVMALFGPMVSTLTTPVAPIAMAGETPQFSPPTAAQALVAEEPSKYNYLIPSLSPYGGEQGSQVQLGRTVAEKYGIKTIAALNPKDSAGTVYTPLFLEGFEEAGGKVVYNQYFPPETQEFAPYVQAIADKHPEALFFGYTEESMVPIMTLARQENAAKYYIGGAGTSQIPAEESGSEPYTKYVWAAPVLSINDPSPTVTDFVKKYRALTHSEESPNISLAFSTYPFVFVLAKAMEEAGTVTDRAKINEALHGSSWTFPGEAIEKVTIDENGQAWTPYQICDLLKGVEKPTCETVVPDVDPESAG